MGDLLWRRRDELFAQLLATLVGLPLLAAVFVVGVVSLARSWL